MTCARVGYSLGAVSRVDNVLQNYFLNPFLLDIVGLNATFTGNVLLIKQIWDAVTDPAVGYLSDHCNTSFGRRRPFIFMSSPVLWAFWILLWMQLPNVEEQGLLFAYYTITLVVFNTSVTFQMVPYRALLQDAAPTYGIRTKMVALQEMTAMVSFMLAVLIHGKVVVLFKYDNGSVNYQLGYLVSALFFAPLIAFPRIVTAAFITERPVEEGGG
eukprot:CAMPEP_0119128790 /NCGR_PEP_ID=MMETSP1310-20130426/6802_1 /TAXON_ID=464262 /ORGANISM="Genus nov. species nov., Strain RCC2339" /LENGTH=213 /DNA_ID=CAMNT_0007119161 /DNA_START=150 /DNA_END=787 /DNA_ORIENTATION=+